MKISKLFFVLVVAGFFPAEVFSAGQVLNELSSGDHGTTIYSTAFSPDGNYLAVAGLRAGSDPYYTHRIFPVVNGVIGAETSSADHGATLYSVAWSPDGKWLVIGGWTNSSKRIRVYPVTDGVMGTEAGSEETGGNVYSLGFSKDGKYLFAGHYSSLSKDLKIYEVSSVGALTIRGNYYIAGSSSGYVRSLTFSPDGRYLVCGTSFAVSGQVTHRVYSIGTDGYTLTQVGSGYTAGGIGRCVLISPDGKYLAVSTSSTGGNQKFYSFTDGLLTEVSSEDGHGSSVRYASWSPDGNYFVVGGSAVSSVTHRVYSVADGVLGAYANYNHGGEVMNVAFSPDGKYLALGGSSGTGTKTHRIYRSWSGPIAGGAPVTTGFSAADMAQNTDIASNTEAIDTLRNEMRKEVYDLKKRATPSASDLFNPTKDRVTLGGLGAHGGTLRTAKWRRGNKYIAVGGDASKIDSCTLRVFKFDEERDELDELPGCRLALTTVKDIDWSPDGRFLAVAKDNTAGDYFVGDVYEFHDFPGEEHLEFAARYSIGSSNSAISVAWRSYGRMVLWGSSSGYGVVCQLRQNTTTGLWELPSVASDEIISSRPLNSVSWKPDGTEIVAVTNAASGEATSTIYTKDFNAAGTSLSGGFSSTNITYQCNSVRYSSDGTELIVAAEGDGDDPSCMVVSPTMGLRVISATYRGPCYACAHGGGDFPYIFCGEPGGGAGVAMCKASGTQLGMYAWADSVDKVLACDLTSDSKYLVCAGEDSATGFALRLYKVDNIASTGEPVELKSYLDCGDNASSTSEAKSVVWSLDGKYVAVSTEGGTSTPEVIIAAVNDDSLNEVCRVAVTAEGTSSNTVKDLSWSSTGEYIAVLSTGTDGSWSAKVYVYKFDGTSLVQKTSAAIPDARNGSAVSFSPDDAYLAVGTTYSNLASLFVYPVTNDSLTGAETLGAVQSHAGNGNGSNIRSIKWDPTCKYAADYYFVAGGTFNGSGYNGGFMKFTPPSSFVWTEKKLLGTTAQILYSVAWSSDGKYVAAGGQSEAESGGQLRSWTVSAWDVTATPTLGSPFIWGDTSGDVYSVDWSSDRRMLAVSGRDYPTARSNKDIFIYSMEDLDDFASSENSGWDARRIGALFSGSTTYTESCAFSPNGGYLATAGGRVVAENGDDYSTLRLWSVASSGISTDSEVTHLIDPEGVKLASQGRACAWSHDGNYVAFFTNSVVGVQELAVLKKTDNGYEMLECVENGDSTGCGSSGKTIAWLPDRSDYFVYTTAGNYLKLAKVVGNTFIKNLDSEAVGSTTYGVVVKKQTGVSEYFVAVSYYSNFKMYRFDVSSESFTLADSISSLASGGSSADFSEDATKVFFGNVTTLSARTVSSTGTLSGTSSITDASYINDLGCRPGSTGTNAVIAVAHSEASEKTVSIYSFDGTSFTLRASANTGAPANAIDWSPDGKYVVVGGQVYNNFTHGIYEYIDSGGTYGLRRVAAEHWGGNANGVQGLAWSPDGTKIAIATNSTISGAYAHIQDVTTIKGNVPEVPEHVDQIKSASFSADSKYVAAVQDKAVQIYKVDDFDELELVTTLDYSTTYSQHAHCMCAEWSPDNQFLAVAGEPVGRTSSSFVTVRVYKFDGSTLTEESYSNLRAADSGTAETVNSLSWSSDGRFIVIGGEHFSAGSARLRIFEFLRYGTYATSSLVSKATWEGTDGLEADVVDVAWRPWTMEMTISTSTKSYLLGYDGTTTITPAEIQLGVMRPRDMSWSGDGRHLVVREGGGGKRKLAVVAVA
ncbi:WD40 repeat domain-containing protein [bacterium]|nr:WD40 repeat domain-containing protein [bacterium]